MRAFWVDIGYACFGIASDEAVVVREYECWYMGSQAKPDESAALHAQYLLDWRACERFLDKSCFDVVPYCAEII